MKDSEISFSLAGWFNLESWIKRLVMIMITALMMMIVNRCLFCNLKRSSEFHNRTLWSYDRTECVAGTFRTHPLLIRQSCSLFPTPSPLAISFAKSSRKEWEKGICKWRCTFSTQSSLMTFWCSVQFVKHKHTRTHTHKHIHTYITHTKTHTHVYTHTYIHIYAYTHIHVYKHIHTYIHTYIHNTYIHTHTYICTYIHTCIHTLIHTHIHTYIQTNIHTYTHTHIYIYIYVNTNMEGACTESTKTCFLILIHSVVLYQIQYKWCIAAKHKCNASRFGTPT